ncbi:integrase [Streptomyces chartreusis]|uniref:Integrase n=1 Tax=Streptomyces chartreusis TaxID=1969 RepID=A0A7H8TA33_STRCX|nr:integrase [Streptomyces chartreusis]QKZ20336.1 integrase [Streptomyces chartreusis]
MTSTELVPVPGRTPLLSRRRAEPDVRTRSGERISASAARKVIDAVPQHTRDSRDTRWRSFSLWCATYQWAEDEPNAVLSYLSDLGDRGHPSKTLEAHLGTLRALRAVQKAPLSPAEIKACRLVIRHRAGEEADDPMVEPGPLQADAVDLDELRQMVRTADRATRRGKQVAVTLLLDWWMAGRASEPARLNLHDVKVTTVKVEDTAGRTVTRQALIIKIRRSKADQNARGQDVRILAQDDPEICPVNAVREWLGVLTDDGQLTPGPFLRRIDRHGNIGAKAAGRHTKDPRRRGGITADTVNDIVKAAARAAELTPTPTPEELAATAKARQDAYAAAEAAPTAEEANEILKAWRTARRAARAAVRRITGHSMRRGWIQTALDAGNPPEVVALHSRHSLRSAAFDAYRKKKVPWNQNPTRFLGLAA